MENQMSPADFNALMGNANGAWGGGSIFFLIILFLFFMGGNGWRNNGDYGQYATAASQQQILFGQQFQNIDNKIDRIGNGIADATFALNNVVHNAQDVVAGAVTTEGRGIQMQIADYGCAQKEATAQVRYDMANFAAQINHNIDNKFAALEKSGLEQTIAAQNARIQQLELNSAMCGVVRYPNGMTYTAGTSPFCNCNCNCCG